ncbi:hypothetical protein B0T16DRAFT_414649, partial [Cercophora newfieldiana]
MSIQSHEGIRLARPGSGSDGAFALLDDEAMQAGTQVELVGVINGVPIPSLTGALWQVNGNVQAVESANYDVTTGVVQHPILVTTYPLKTAFVFMVSRTVPFDSFQVSLEGLLPGGVPFAATRTFILRGPGIARVSKLWMADDIGIQITPLGTYCGLVGPGNKTGIKLQCELAYTTASGSLRVLSLGKVKSSYTEGGNTTVLLDTKDRYWWDGTLFPYDNVITPVVSGQPATVAFEDNPGTYLSEDAKQRGITYHLRAAWKTYFVFLGSAPGAVPVILDVPFTWLVEFDVSWDADKKFWAVANKKFQNSLPYYNFNLPYWLGNLHPVPGPAQPMDSELPTAPRLLNVGITDNPSRSTYVTFKNYTDAYMVLQSAHLDHGMWTENKYPPEQIGAGGPENPVQVSWSSQSDGFMTGTEGYVMYRLQDMQTTMKVYWDNPYVGSNGYSITLDGPLAGGYKGEHS